MKILTSFEKAQITKVLNADFNGAIHCHTFNYLKDLLYFKHLCICELCNLLHLNISNKVEKIKRDIDYILNISTNFFCTGPIRTISH